MAKYDSLRRYLIRKMASDFVLTFSAIEKIIEAPLPPSATRTYWWAIDARETAKRSHRQAWLSVGYDARLLSGRKVRFSKPTDAGNLC